jgi:hypothetical protein
MTKTRERQRKVTSKAKHKLHTENSKKAPPEQMQAPPEHVSELTPATNVSKSNLFNTRSLSSQSAGIFV